MSAKIIIISDCHLSRNNELLFKKYDVEKNIQLLDTMIQQENPDCIFVLGDISQDGSPESYIKAKHQFEKYQKPVYFIPGNHDDLDNIKTLESSLIRSTPYLDIVDHRFIFVNTKLDNSDSGFISDTELNKIRRHRHPDKINHLIMHHHFLPLNSFLDKFILTTPEGLISIVNENWLNSIFTGHIHNGIMKTYGNTNIYHSPSTCVQFALTRELVLENVIGYRVINLDSKNLTSYVKLLQL